MTLLPLDEAVELWPTRLLSGLGSSITRASYIAILAHASENDALALPLIRPATGIEVSAEPTGGDS